MSELRDLTEVFRAIQVSLRDLGEHVASQDANGAQLRERLHELSNHMTRRDGNTDENFDKLNEWMKKFDVGQKALSEGLSNLQDSVASHRREIGQRIRKYEDKDEITNPGVKV